MGILKITHGLPASGKSTFAKNEVKKAPNNVVRINRDDIREQLFGAEYNNHLPDSKKEVLVTEIQNSLIEKELSKNKTVWVDDTNLNRRTVKKLFNLGQGHTIEQFYFDVPVEECIRRNELRAAQGGHKVNEDSIFRMAKEYYDDFGHIKEFKQDSRGDIQAIPRKTFGSVKIDKFNEKLSKNRVEGNAIVLVDVDGTLINNEHIANVAFADKKKDYDLFFKTINKAPVNKNVVDLANRMREDDNLNIVVLTGRDDKYADELIEAVENSGINSFKLIAKKHGDYRADFEFKKEVLEGFKKEGLIPVHAIDDRERSVELFKKSGILVSKVRIPQGNPQRDNNIPYDTPSIDTIYGSGLCLRCGKPIKKGNIGPVCRTR